MMTDNHIPTGRQSTTPFICVMNYPEFLTFVQEGLGAKIVEQQKNDQGEVFLATLNLNGSIIHTMQAWNAEAATPAMLYVYVPSVEKAVERAIAAGAEPSEGGANPFGDEHGVVTDKWNNFWWFASTSEEF